MSQSSKPLSIVFVNPDNFHIMPSRPTYNMTKYNSRKGIPNKNHKYKEWSLENFDEGFIASIAQRFTVYAPTHPRASKSGYILRARIAYETYNQTTIPEGWDVHHIDGNTLNDSKENLKLVTKKEHRRIDAGLDKNYTFYKNVMARVNYEDYQFCETMIEQGGFKGQSDFLRSLIHRAQREEVALNNG